MALLNPSIVVQYIERYLGVSLHYLELSPEEVINTVFAFTLPTFSTYYPYFVPHPIRHMEDQVPGRVNAYYINSPLQVLGVSKILVENYMGGSGLPLTIHDNHPIYSQFASDLQSMVVQPITFEWEPPNIVSLYPKTHLLGDFMVELKTVHPNHLATIELGLRDEFLKLALLDVRISLYPMRQRFSSLNTAYGNIELFMDKLESASDDRETLLEKWRENFINHHKRRKIYVY